jgi:segregation and condensation protein A
MGGESIAPRAPPFRRRIGCSRAQHNARPLSAFGHQGSSPAAARLRACAEESSVSYRVQLPVFSGPMDLLLHLVRQQEVDVHEISIAPILKDYLKHLDVLKQLDLHDIGDFVVMASTLMEIKSRELLPTEAVELEEELDPKDDLIRRLLEYKRYRDLARELDSRADRRSRQTPLVMALPKELQDTDEDDQLDIGKVQVWDLTSAFAKLLDQIGQQATMEIEVDKRDVGYYTRRLLTQFKEKREVGFTEIFDKREGRYGLIGTLIALLEMMKQELRCVLQSMRAHLKTALLQLEIGILLNKSELKFLN